MICCTRCDAALQGDLSPGDLVKCQSCGQKNRLPQLRKFAELIFAATVREEAVQQDQYALADAIAVAKLNGVRWRPIRSQLDAAGVPMPQQEQACELAKEAIRQESRLGGRKMLLTGLACIAICVIATAVMYYMNWNLYISVGLLALGAVYSLVGAVKWVTGWNIN